VKSSEAIAILDARTRRRWRKWLENHQDSESEVWLVFHKKDSGVTSLSYEDAIEEALCHGWIDSIVRRIDETRYARKFTPRRVDSRWSTANRLRYADLESRGLLAARGLERAPTSRSGDAPRPSVTTLPSHIARGLKADPRASRTFEQLAPSCRRAYIGWIDSAKRDETKKRRLEEALRLLAAGKKLGLK
jgi:uncharacterized protein YdeI (YjbR/CyaY-like superfamily)